MYFSLITRHIVIQDDYIVKDGSEILIVKKKDFEANYRELED